MRARANRDDAEQLVAAQRKTGVGALRAHALTRALSQARDVRALTRPLSQARDVRAFNARAEKGALPKLLRLKALQTRRTRVLMLSKSFMSNVLRG